MSRLSPWLVPSLLWLWLFANLHVEWTLNPQYNYGWGVPVLAVLLFYFRWQSRPAPNVGERNRAIITVSMTLGLAMLFPVRVIEEANPDWRFLSWILGFLVVDFSLLSLLRAGGTRWLKHFAFPVCFPLTAVPWPMAFENLVIQTLMRAVAFAAVEIAGWFGVGAYQLGNVIQLRNGFVGVDEACSGVKTVQAGIMVALVLGELLRLRWTRRVGLVLLGCSWVFVCNVFRATALVFIAANSGFEALSRWHDRIGTGALLCGIAGILALAWLWKPQLRADQSAPVSSGPARIFPLQPGAFIWLLAIFLGTEFWYRSHEGQLIERPRWQVAWPAANETVTALSIESQTAWAAALKATDNRSDRLAAIARLAEGWDYAEEAADAWWLIANGNENAKQALTALQRLYKTKQNSHGLLRVAKRALELNPADLVAANNCANLGLLLGADRTSRRLATKLHAENPTNAAVSSTYAFALFTEGKTSEALREMETLKEAQLRHPAIAAYYFVMLVENGKMERAHAFLSAANKAQLLPEEQQLLVSAIQKLLQHDSQNVMKTAAADS